MNVKTYDGFDDPFGSLIESHFRREFPELTHLTCDDVLDALTSVFVSTKETRYGPTPDPEHLVRLRSVIRKSLETGRPIPILVPWGSVKSDITGQLDVAELMAVRRLACLSKTVKRYHAAGIEAVIRVGDQKVTIRADYLVEQ